MVYIRRGCHRGRWKVLVPFDFGVVYIGTVLTGACCGSFSPLWFWGGLYHKYAKEIPTINVLVPFDFGVVYIATDDVEDDSDCFSPLWFWGGLYQLDIGIDLIYGFSPLWFWGGLYHSTKNGQSLLCFSPLWFWGGLYLQGLDDEIHISVLVPFDFGVVYISATLHAKKIFKF